MHMILLWNRKQTDLELIIKFKSALFIYYITALLSSDWLEAVDY